MTSVIQEEMKKNKTLRYGLYNFQVALDNDDNTKASLTSILGGTKTCIHIYIERLDVMKVPTDSEESNAKYLFQVYQEKDRLHEYFREHGHFPGIEKEYVRRVPTMLNWLAWMLITYVTLIYQYYVCFTSGSTLYIMFMLTLALSVVVSVRMMVNSTKVSKSSSYGTTISSSKSSNKTN